MPVIAVLLLVWQRRRVVSAFTEARAAWIARGRDGASPAGRSADVLRRVASVGARTWRAVDTPVNASRVQRLVTTLRSAAARAEADAATAPTV